VLEGRFETTPLEQLRTISVAAPDETADLEQVAGAVRAAGIAVDEIALRRPTLDDAFLALTGHPVAPDTAETADVADPQEMAA
jgi:ABC-2 type transport system ATP-binding protein